MHSGESPLPRKLSGQSTRRGGRYPGAAKMNRLALEKFVAAEFTAKRPSRMATHRLRVEIQILPKPNQGVESRSHSRSLARHRHVSLRAPYPRLSFCAANDPVLSVEHGDARMMSFRFFQGESRKAHDS